MAVVQVLTVILLCVVLSAGLYVLWLNFPHETRNYDPFIANVTYLLPTTSSQFYPNLRYPDRNIGYFIEAACLDKKEQEIKQAFRLIENFTVLRFHTSPNATLRILCSKIAPEPKTEGHFVAGEGGPTEIINTSRYAVILAGKVSLYRPEKCQQPNIAIHEIFHALGFDHTSDKKSIMYPITECSQQIGENLTAQINELYRTDSLSDITIERLSANMTGNYLNFEIIVTNSGLRDVANSSVSVVAKSKLIKKFSLEEISIGQKKTLYVKNLRMPRDAENITFMADNLDQTPELDYENNKITLELRV